MDSWVPANHDHDRSGSGRQGKGDVTGVTDASISPDGPVGLGCCLSALQNRGELRTPDAGLHTGGAHGARPNTDLDDVRPGLQQVQGAAPGDDVASHDRDTASGFLLEGGANLVCHANGPDHGVLVAVSGVHDEDVGTGVQSATSATGDVAVDADGSADHEVTVGIDGRAVDLGAQRATGRHDADEDAGLVDGHSDLLVTLCEGLEDVVRTGVRADQGEVGGHDLMALGEAVDALRLGRGDQSDRAMVLDDEDDAVGALVEQTHGLADGRRGIDGDRGVEAGVGTLDPTYGPRDEVSGDVLGQDGDAAAAGDRLGHPSSGDRGHVGHDEGQGSA